MTITTKLTSLISTQKEVCSHCPHDMGEIPEGVIIYSYSDPKDADLTHLFHYHCVFWKSCAQEKEGSKSLSLTLKDRSITITHIDDQTIQEYRTADEAKTVFGYPDRGIDAYLIKAPNAEELRKDINNAKIHILKKTIALSETFCAQMKQESLLQSNVLFGYLTGLETNLKDATKPISEGMLGRAVIKAAGFGQVLCVEKLVEHGTISPKDRGLAICAVLANVDLYAHREDSVNYAHNFQTDIRFGSPSFLRNDIVYALLKNKSPICQEELDKAYVLHYLLPETSPMTQLGSFFTNRDDIARGILVPDRLERAGTISPKCLDLVKGINLRNPHAIKEAKEFVKLDTEGYLKAIGAIDEEEKEDNTAADTASNTNTSANDTTSANVIISAKTHAQKQKHPSYATKLATTSQLPYTFKPYVARYTPPSGHSTFDAIVERSAMIFLKAVTPSIAFITAAACGGAFIALGALNPITLALGITALVATIATGILFLASETPSNTISTIIEIAQIAFPLIAGICALVAFAQLGIASPITIALLVTAGVGLIVSIAVSYFSLKPDPEKEIASLSP